MGKEFTLKGGDAVDKLLLCGDETKPY
jgi:hypothetical protein